MERQTFERALHKWNEWHDSIERSRKLLGYNPKWPRETCIGWIEEHYPAVKEQAEEELKKLELPPTLRTYWEDCLYSDYRRRDGNTDYSKITRRLSEERSLPNLPCDWGVVWYEGEDTDDPWLRVEMKLNARFATKELFEYAAKYAYCSVQGHLERQEVRSHPVCNWLKGGRPPADESLALECAWLKDGARWTHKEIGLHFGWPLQEDSYGNLSQCSTARHYVKWGRELRKKNQQ